MDMQAGIWTGDALIDLRDNIDTASGTWSTTTALVDTGWVGTSGISLAVYQDDNNNEVDYLSWEYGFGWIYSNTELRIEVGRHPFPLLLFWRKTAYLRSK